jgi:hypothetical protein
MNKSTKLLMLFQEEQIPSHFKNSRKAFHGLNQQAVHGRLAVLGQLENGCLKINFHLKQLLRLC